MLDLNGVNPKDRPAVIVGITEDPVGGTLYTVIAITTLYPDRPLPAFYVRMPWQHNRHSKTGLDTNCAAVCYWAENIGDDRILDLRGHTPGKTMEAIADMIRRYDQGG
jgi:hypothetical protein